MDLIRAVADPDLARLHQLFFDEAEENLAQMEAMLLAFDAATADVEGLDAIFRCAHSVKGGAAALGFQALARLTHAMEGLLDGVRKRRVSPDAVVVDALLDSGDLARALIRSSRGDAALSGLEGLPVDLEGAAVEQSCARLAGLSSDTASSGHGMRTRILRVSVARQARRQAVSDIVGAFEQIAGLGKVRVMDEVVEAEGACCRFEVSSSSSDEDLLDLFGLYVDREAVELVDPGLRLRGDAPAIAERDRQRSSTLRVPAARLDALIELVADQVIGQSALARVARESGFDADGKLWVSIDALERNTRRLQEAVMAIRMLRIETVFMRLPRLVRDLSSRLGKEVELQTAGELTELDRGMIDLIVDPLTHLVRNAIDHGIESPAERAAGGKPATGRVTVSASQSHGSISIEVSDDGRGLDREQIIAAARKAGIVEQPECTDFEVYQLLFTPGLTTAGEANEVSGRGVGLDVVRRSVQTLGGTVALTSDRGRGTRVTIRVPLTMAIVEAMSVAVGAEVYVIPVAAVVESMQLCGKQVRVVAGGGRAVEVRGQHVPLVALADVFAVELAERDPADQIVVVLESNGLRAAILVDALIRQRQFVVKSFESNYRRIPGVAGATILGDGQVALIVDVAHLVRRSRH